MFPERSNRASAFGTDLMREKVPTTGVAVYGLLALADLLSIFRAAFDARYHHP